MRPIARRPLTLLGAVSLGPTLLLAACSGGAPADQSEAAANDPAPSATGAASEPTAGGGVSVATTVGGMRAEVSSLTGSVSGLNTRITDMGTVIDLPADALFDFDKAELTPAAATELAKAAELIRAGPPGPIQVIGHTDSKGDDAYNQKLSEARARTVADWFGEQVGVRQRAFQVSGKGESAPIAADTRPDGSDDPAARAKNRRVEVIIPKGRGA